MPRGGTNYIPRPDGDFSAFSNHYSKAVHDFWAAHLLNPADLTALDAALTAWNKDYPAHTTAQAAAEGARQNKDASRRLLEAAIRPVTAFVQGYNKTTDAERATIGITVRDTSKTPAPTPTSAHAGKTAYYALRWVSTRGEKGPWSEVCAATVAA